MSAPRMLNTQDLIRELNLPMTSKDVTTVLDRLKIAPLATAGAGRGTMRFYDPSALDALRQYRAEVEAKKKPKPAPVPASAPTAETSPLDNLALNMSKQRLALQAQNELLEALDAKLSTVHEQHVSLLRAIEKIGLDLSNKIAAVQETVDAPPVIAETPVLTTVSKAPAPAPVAPPPPKKRKVGVVGLLAHQKQVVMKEFGEAYDLRFFESDDAKGRGFVEAASRCEAVIAMTSFINHGIEATIRAAGGKLIRVNGGVTSLRDKLTALYIEEAAA